VPDAPLSIVQVAPHRRSTPNPVNEFVVRLSEELERRGHEVLRIAAGDSAKRQLAAAAPDIVHVH
jgi:hypothetical protein